MESTFSMKVILMLQISLNHFWGGGAMMIFITQNLPTVDNVTMWMHPYYDVS